MQHQIYFKNLLLISAVLLLGACQDITEEEKDAWINENLSNGQVLYEIHEVPFEPQELVVE